MWSIKDDKTIPGTRLFLVDKTTNAVLPEFTQSAIGEIVLTAESGGRAEKRLMMGGRPVFKKTGDFKIVLTAQCYVERGHSS